MHCHTVTTLCGVLVAAAAVAVTGKPHQCFLDDYAKALLTQYYPAEMAAAMAEAAKPVPLEYEEPTPCRSGRSNDRAPPAVPVAEPIAVAAEPVTVAKFIPVAQPGAPVSPPQLLSGGANDTSSANTVEKLKAYYDELRGQQEALVRDQLQKQLFAQQRSRQQEFALTVQQMQQQYYQQQQHALLMLEQLRKNPGFAGQLTAFNRMAAVNGSLGLPQAAAAMVLPQVAAAVVQSPQPDAEVQPTSHNKATAKASATEDQDVVEDQGAAESDCEAKHLASRQTVDSELTEDQPTIEDDQTSPVLKKVYSMVAE